VSLEPYGVVLTVALLLTWGLSALLHLPRKA